jgi:CSLREA domain-containing protein
MSVARRLAVVLLAMTAAAGLVVTAWPRRVRAAVVIVVDTTSDADVGDAACSLREAIIAANADISYHGCLAPDAGVGDEIVFSLDPGSSTINIGTTPLPAITQSVTIDGGAGRVELHGPGGPLVSGHHGLTVAPGGFDTIIRNLVINSAADDGIFINADDVSVFGCYIGTDATGMTPVPNQGVGVQVSGGTGVHIGGATTGGSCTGDCNVISGAGDLKPNVLLDLNSTSAVVRGNFIGTDVTGSAAITPNTAQGITDKGLGNQIGGTDGTTPGGPCTGDCNLISGNNFKGGIFIDQAASDSIVQGNFVGTDVTGNDPISNGGNLYAGISTQAVGTTIGGTVPAARNVVSGNVGAEVAVDNAANTIVQGNYIGTNAAGTAAVADSGTGIFVKDTNGATIGGDDPGAGNLISGAGSFGIRIFASTNIQVLANLIGTAADGTTALPNLSDGVFISDQSSNNRIGNGIINAGNIIAFNGGAGIHIDGSVPPVLGNAFHLNSIYANGGAGIALTANANDNLAPPTITGIDPLHGTTCSQCVVEIFSDDGNEGRILEAILLSDDGTWTFDGPLNGPHVTATNTDFMAGNNTSEFSAPVALPTATASPSQTPGPSATLAASTVTVTAPPTQTRTRTATSTRTASAAASATPSSAASASPTQTGTASVATTATATASRTPTEPEVSCAGDCDDDHVVSISELITGVNIALGSLAVSACPAFENGAGAVDIAQLIKGVGNALNGCGGVGV